MHHADRITQKNDRLKVVSIGLIGLGILVILVTAIYILNASTVSILAAEDGMIGWIGAHAYEIGWISFLIAIFGTLLKWRAEDSQEVLEKTTRFVDYDELRELQAARRR